MIKGLERDREFLRLLEKGFYSVSINGVITKDTGKVIGNPKNEFVVMGKDRNYFPITYTRALWLAYKGLIPFVEGDEYFVSYKDKSKPLHLDNLELKLLSTIRKEAGKRAVAHLNPKGSAKITDEQVLALRREFMENPKVFFIRQRARELSVSHATLSAALSGRTFKNVPEPVPKEAMKKPGGNNKPRVWDRKSSPSYKEPKLVTVEKRAVEKVKTVEPPLKVQTPVVKKTMTEEDKRNRLEMMKRIGERNKRTVRNFD